MTTQDKNMGIEQNLYLWKIDRLVSACRVSSRVKWNYLNGRKRDKSVIIIH